ncbi:ABC transporter permease [Arthrobacter mobilis]|uniref:Transport permease protein n=1 Tax=Arthrobacter mobilis TaxID=2724944 RepID=A0A7X6HFF1_9MICC|nr:ABC transporter permease [Arthrobacter mobilis]NKX55365.1 ABC transporter permease [Arthrobacter mobilis]
MTETRPPAAEPASAPETITVPVSLKKLRRIGARPGFTDYLVQLWDRRQFIAFDAQARVQTANDKDKLGSLWLILTPLFNGLTYYFIFGMLLGTGRGIDNFVGYLVIGIFTFQFSASAILAGARSLVANESVIKAFTFPRAALPIAANLRELLSSVPSTIVMLLLVIVAAPVEEITWRWLLIIPVMLLQHLFNLGLSMLLAPFLYKVHDIGNLLSFVLRLWMYGSAVFYSFDRFNEYPPLVKILEANPLFCVIDIVRDSVLYAATPAWQSWATLAVWSLGLLAAGFFVFWRQEESYGRVS